MSIQAASQSVLAALRSKRIGTPVSVRIVDCGASEVEQLEPRLAEAMEMASRWLGAEVRRLAALGDMESGQLSVLMEFRQGQTALVSVGTRGHSRPLLEVTVVGSRGIFSWEPGFEPAAGPELAVETPSAEGRRVVDAVARSLGTGGPVWLSREGEGQKSASAVKPRQRDTDEGHGGAVRPTRTEPPYGVLLVAGAHTHQENYAADLAADSRCRLVGLTDEADVPERRRALNEALARKLGIPHLSDFEQALARKNVHIVSVCAEPERRAKLMVRCAEAGKHLYLDKPMTASVAEADAVRAAVRQSGVITQMFSQVHFPASARVRRLVESGSLGELKAVHSDLTFAKGPAGTVPIDKPRAEHANPGQFELVDSKRELYNVGVYQLVLLDWLLRRRVERVWAVTGNYFFAEHKRNDMEDFAVALMELEGGITATLACGRAGWRSHPQGGMNRVSLVGSRRVASIDAYRPRLEVWADENPWLPPKVHPEDPMGFWKSTFDEVDGMPKQAWVTPPGEGGSDATHFLDCIEAGRPGDVSAEVGARVVKVLMAAYESAATGRFVTPSP